MGKDCHRTQSTEVLTISPPKQQPPPSPPWCKWFILSVAFTINTLITGIASSFGILFVELHKEFKQGKGRTAAVGSVAIGLMFGVGPVAGGLCKRWGTRTVSVVGSVLSIISLLVSGYSSSLDVLYGTYSVLAGIGFGFLNIASMLCVAEHFGKKMGLACALTSSGSGVGNLLFPIIINNLIQNYGWRKMLTIIAGIQTLAIICSAAMFPKIRDGHNICGFRKQPKSKDKKMKKEMSIPSLYPNLYAAFKLFLDNKVDRSAADTVRRTSSVEAEFRDGVDIILNSLDLTTNSPCDSTDCLNQPNTFKENGEQGSTENKTQSSPKPLNTTEENEPVQKIFIVDSSFAHQTTQPDRPPHYLNTSDTNGNCADDQHAKRPSKPPAIKLLFSCDLFVFGNVKYFIFLICCLLATTGACVPPIIISDHALSFDVSPGHAAILVSVIGVTGTVGRLLAGLASCHSKMDIVALYMIHMFIGGIATLVTPLLLQYWSTMLFSALFGLFYGVTAGLDPSMLVKFVGNENLAMGYGFFSLALGIGSGISAPIAGLLRDSTGNYNCSFYVAGLLMILSSICVFSLFMISRTRSKDLEFKERTETITLIRYQCLH